MNEYLYDSYDNPLEAIADELSQALNSKSVDIHESTTNQIDAGQPPFEVTGAVACAAATPGSRNKPAAVAKNWRRSSMVAFVKVVDLNSFASAADGE